MKSKTTLMKPFLIIVILLFCTLTALGQQPEYPDSGFTDKAEAKNLTVNGLKEGKWVEYYRDKGEWILPVNSFDSANYYCLIIYTAGKIDGIKRRYYKNGKIESITPFLNGKENGIIKQYFANGNRRDEIPYNDGKLDGVWKEYYEDGKLKSESHYTNNINNGIDKIYYESGHVKFETPYANNKVNGIFKEYYESGKLKSETPYIDGNRGEIKQYDENGNEIKQ